MKPNGCFHKWMVYNGKWDSSMDDLGVPLFQEPNKTIDSYPNPFPIIPQPVHLGLPGPTVSAHTCLGPSHQREQLKNSGRKVSREKTIAASHVYTYIYNLWIQHKHQTYIHLLYPCHFGGGNPMERKLRKASPFINHLVRCSEARTSIFELSIALPLVLKCVPSGNQTWLVGKHQWMEV